MTDAVQQAAERIRFAEKNAELRGVIVDYLRSLNGDGHPGIALSNACFAVQHVRVRKDGGCHCGKLKGRPDASV